MWVSCKIIRLSVRVHYTKFYMVQNYTVRKQMSGCPGCGDWEGGVTLLLHHQNL